MCGCTHAVCPSCNINHKLLFIALSWCNQNGISVHVLVLHEYIYLLSCEYNRTAPWSVPILLLSVEECLCTSNHIHIPLKNLMVVGIYSYTHSESLCRRNKDVQLESTGNLPGSFLLKCVHESQRVHTQVNNLQAAICRTSVCVVDILMGDFSGSTHVFNYLHHNASRVRCVDDTGSPR